MEVKPLKSLIAEYGVSFDANTILNALINSGHVKNEEYPSTTGSGVMKSFKRLTTAGEQYGVNKSTMHPFKTEPRFFDETFPQLLKVVVDQLHSEVAQLLTDPR
ncbi:hypothetical protein NJF44_15575 [Pseudomonas guariconensis]|uniref:hypothetical protein n=1 Tax=Pseudomonas TaxID=286 RepID=UPI002097C2E0|nr:MULTISPECIES: hypothetical protein [Pseudomonas]MCO7636260.1 hypothetical protein [Pseudomonas sp. S 311-6]MCO7516442.1 hypothetical protein [Pseudomonas putida]MCO7563897.1 hypothetical protein [Pseudomonas mosselii]MCO7606658.1 hypothetical protein [Pseudomonas guariconensis]MCO7615297.1 hypothetical protein [Pseudomonas guariconensis]